MNSPFQPKKLNVPGLMGDDALNESLKQFASQGNAAVNAAPPPSSAVDMVDRIQKEYLDKPSPSIRGATAALPGPLGVLAGAVGDVAGGGPAAPAGPAPVDPQQRAVDVRSDILASTIPDVLRNNVITAPAMAGADALSALGTLATPEARQAEADQRAVDAKVNEATVNDQAAVRAKLRGLTDQQAADMGMPVAPGGTPPEATAEAAKNDAGIVAAAAKANQEAIAATKDPAKQPTQTWWLNAMQSGVKGFAQMGTGTASGILEVSEMARDASALDLLTGGGRSNLRAWVDTVDATLTKMLPGDKARSKDFITQLSQGTGSMAGFLLAGYIGAAFGFPAKATTMVVGAATQGDQQFKDAEAHGAGAVTKYLSLIAGGAIGLTEAIPLDRMFTRADNMTGGLVRRLLNHTAAGSIEEFAQEFGQAVGSDVVARLLYDEKRKFDLGSYLKQGLVGGLTGGLVGAATTAMHETGVSSRVADPAAPPPAERETMAQSVIDTLQAQLDKLPGMTEHEAAQAAEVPLANIVPPEPAAQTQVVQGPGGSIPVNATGQFEAHHESAQQLDTIDPAKRGTGPLRGGERQRLFGADAVDRSYFGVGDPAFVRSKDQPYKSNTDPYHGEGLGPFRHTVEADPKTIYNWYEDPLNLKSQLDRSTPASEQVTRYEKLIKDAGFKGIYMSESPLGQVAAMFEATKPAKVVDKRTGLVQNFQVPNVAKVELQPQDTAPLPGLTNSPGPVKNVVQAARAYAEARGLPVRRQGEYVQNDPALGKRIADAYEAMKHQPNNPKVKAAYQAMADETMAQYEFVKATGLKVEFIKPDQENPYASPKQVLADLQKGHLWVFPTESGFGSSEADVKDNPLLAPTGEVVDGHKLVVNDVFRIVHDFFGHGIEGSSFGPRGEENAWQSHMRLYSAAALPAVTSETRGQNSWVNYGPHGEANRANQQNTVYADQKTGIMPSWTWTEGVADDGSEADLLARIETPERGVAARQGELDHLTADDMAALDEGLLANVQKQDDPIIAIEQALHRFDTGQGTAKEVKQVIEGLGWSLDKSGMRGSNKPIGVFDPDGNHHDIFANVGPRPRTTATGELQRPAGGVPGEAQAGELSDVNLAKIGRGFTKLLGSTVRQGRITAKGTVAGQTAKAVAQYDRKQDVIRVRQTGDVEDLVHEGGHDLYFNAGDNLKIFIAGNDAGLMKVADDLYGGDTNVMPKATHIAEGFAEFFRVYTLNRAFAETHYPMLVEDFDAVLDKDAPQLKAGLALVGQQYAAWMQMPSAQVLRNMIVTGQQTRGLNAAMKELADAGFQTWMHEYARRSVDASVNRNASLNDLVSQTLNIAQENKGQSLDLKRADDPRVLQRLASNTGARAMVEVTDGVMGYNSTVPMTRSLREALLRYHGKTADQNLFSIDAARQADFAAYLVALRGIDEFRRRAEGKIKNMPLGKNVHLAELSTTVAELEGKYGTDFSEAAKIVHEYAMGLWQKSFDAGLMSEETYTDGLDRQFYVPLQRDMSDKKASLGASALTGASNLVKRFKGSDRNVVDPMDVLMHKTFALEKIINRNEVFRTLGKLAERAGKAGAMIERVPAHQLMGKQLSVADAARALTKDDTLTEADAQDLMEILQASIEQGNSIDMFRSEPIHTKGENILFGWENGKLAALQLADGDLGADVVNVINGLGQENLPLFTSIIGSATTAFRAGIVSWPDFLVANFIKDQFSTFILTDVGYKPFFTGVRGMYDELRQANWGRQYNAAMGSMGGMNVANLHDASINRSIAALKGKGYLVKSFSGEGGAFKNGIRGLTRVVELSESGTRIGVFKSAYERAKADGLTDWDASVEASYTAMDLMDFGLNGSRTMLFRKTIPFLNAQLQGLYKMARTLGADEVRQRKGLNFAIRAYFKSMKNIDLSRTEKQAINTGRKAWIKMASLGLISAALHFLFKDDPDYQEAGEYLRTTGWVIPMGDGRLFYIPKPYELAILANFTERALETTEGDTEAKSRFVRGLAMTFVPPLSPPLVTALTEQFFNKDSFTGQEIVPSYMQALTPELQFNSYTSTLAKQLGSALGWSPLKIDHFMSSLGATAYRDLMSMYNTTDPNRGTMDASDVPLMRRFYRDANKGSTSSRDFWGLASTLNGTLRSAEVTYKAFLDAGNDHAANDFLETLGADAKAYAILNTDFKADAKRLNPFYRARQLSTITSAMRREMVTDLGLNDTTTKTSLAGIKLTAKEKTDLDRALSEYTQREMRNTLVAMQAPGWAGKKMVNTQTTLNLIGKIEPRVRDELQRRIEKAKVYDFKTITSYWPEVKNRLLRDRENTFLDDILSVAKVMR
jgi:hypothetical protein